MDRDHQECPPNASAVIALTLIDTVAKMLPAQREKRGDHRLEKARDLANEFGPRITEDDRRTIEEKIEHARQIKDVLGSKSGISRFLHAGEYRRATKDAYWWAKTKSERAKDYACFAPLGTSLAPTSEDISDPVIEVALPLYRCYLSCKDAFPSSDLTEEWKSDVLRNACESIGGYLGPLPSAEMFVVASTTLLTDMKAKIKHQVDTIYGFDTSRAPDSISRNAGLAQALLTDLTFIYCETNIGDTPQHPYRHPAIQRAINMMWFQSKDDDGIVFHEHFMPIPIRAIALALTVIECCIGEWTDGTYKASNWKEDHYKTTYLSHIKSLTDLRDHQPPHGEELLAQIQYDLLKEARIHAGAPFEPVIGTGRLRLGALHAAIQEDPPDYPDPGVDLPDINVTSES